MTSRVNESTRDYSEVEKEIADLESRLAKAKERLQSRSKSQADQPQPQDGRETQQHPLRFSHPTCKSFYYAARRNQNTDSS